MKKKYKKQHVKYNMKIQSSEYFFSRSMQNKETLIVGKII